MNFGLLFDTGFQIGWTKSAGQPLDKVSDFVHQRNLAGQTVLGLSSGTFCHTQTFEICEILRFLGSVSLDILPDKHTPFRECVFLSGKNDPATFYSKFVRRMSCEGV